MKKTYVNGTILRVEDYVETVNMTCHNYNVDIMKDTLTDNIDVVNKIPQVRTCRYVHLKKIDITYDYRAVIGRLPNTLFECIDDPLTTIDYQGSIHPMQTIILNGIEYIMPVGLEYDSISIYLLHYRPELGIVKSKYGVYNKCLYIGLIDNDYNEWVIDDYVKWMNDSGLIFCHIIDKNKFKIVNAYSIPFDNGIYEYDDISISGLSREFYVNDVSVTADFIRQMRERYPEIQFYARTEDRDSTKYNEWVNYKILPSPIKHGMLFTSRVVYNSLQGRYWKDAVDIEFEYTTNDLPTLLARRDQFRVGSFFNNDRVFEYIINDGHGEYFDVGYTVFWERDSLETEYSKQTSLDDTGYSQFSYKYIAKLGYTNIEDGYENMDVNVVDSVIYTILYVPRGQDIKKYDDGVTLSDTTFELNDLLKALVDFDMQFQDTYGINIIMDGTTLDISKDEALPTLLNILNNVKSIGEVAKKKSNFVMVASITQVKNLIESYIARVKETDFSIDNNGIDLGADDESTLEITNDTIDNDISIVDDNDNTDDNDDKKDDNNTDDDNNQDNITETEDDHIGEESTINTLGEYKLGKNIGKILDHNTSDDGIIL